MSTAAPAHRGIARPGLTLPAALHGFVALGALLFAAVVAVLVYDRVAAFEEEALETAVSVRTEGSARALARTLEADWRTLQSLASQARSLDPAALGAALSAVSGDGSRISWAGFASPEGTVLAASGDLLLDVDVSARPWFQQGLGGPFAGDVHDAVLLSNLLGGTEADPLRFIDLADRVTDGDRTLGVVGFHIDAGWLEAWLRDEAAALEIDLFLIDPSGTIAASSNGLEAEGLDLASLRSAAVGSRATARETWPDGVTYMTSVIPEVTYGDLPSFGWSLAGRIGPDALAGSRRGLAGTALGILALSGAALVAMSLGFVRLYLAPMARLAQGAQAIADGHDDYPPEFTRTREQADLSAALARLQGRLLRAPLRAAPGAAS